MSKLLSYVVLALAYLGVPAFAEEAKTYATGELIFSDDFNTFDLEKWKHELTMGGGGNWEFEMYVNSRENSYVEDGKLVLRPTLTSLSVEAGLGESGLTSATVDMWGQTPADICTTNMDYGCFRTGTTTNYINPIRSAKIRSNEAFSFTYGRVEVRAKLPKGNWIWPAIWLLPLDNVYGNWPASGEIDMVESMGNDVSGGLNTVLSTLHWGPSAPLNSYKLTQKGQALSSGNYNDDFHTFGLYWDSKGLYTYIDSDSNKVLNLDFSSESFFQRAANAGKHFPYNPWAYTKDNSAPFDQKFYLIFNVAVGGTNGYFPDTLPNKPWKNTDSTAMKNFWDGRTSWMTTWGNISSRTDTSNALVIDSVKVWALPTEQQEQVPVKTADATEAVAQAPVVQQVADQSYLKTIVYILIGICAVNVFALLGMAAYTRSKLRAKLPVSDMEDALIASSGDYVAPAQPTTAAQV